MLERLANLHNLTNALAGSMIYRVSDYQYITDLLEALIPEVSDDSKAVLKDVIARRNSYGEQTVDPKQSFDLISSEFQGLMDEATVQLRFDMAQAAMGTGHA